VSNATVFPVSLEIDSIHAYAYSPRVPGPVAPLAVGVPAMVRGSATSAIPISGIDVTDMNSSGASIVTVTVSDKTLGMLSGTPLKGVTVSGNNQWSVSLTGTLAGVNTALTTLTYKNITTGGTLSDTITVAARDSFDDIDSARISIVLGSGPTITFINFPATPVYSMAHGNEVLASSTGR
jgi:hypothetical protein